MIALGTRGLHGGAIFPWASAVCHKAPISDVATAPVPLMVFVRVLDTVSTTASTISPVAFDRADNLLLTDSIMLFCAIAHPPLTPILLIMIPATRSKPALAQQVIKKQKLSWEINSFRP